jgi:hypothetical protein
MASYSFADVIATIVAPAGNITLAGDTSGAVADEGISVEKAEDRNTMMVGCQGEIMHCKHAAVNGVIRIRLLKTSPNNGKLMNLMNSLDGDMWGTGQFSVRNRVKGDVITAAEVAFTGQPTIVYGKLGGIQEWTFHAGFMSAMLYAGSPIFGVDR